MARRAPDLRLANQLYSAELVRVNRVHALLHGNEEDSRRQDSIFKSNEFSKKINRMILGFCATASLIDLFGLEQTHAQKARISTYPLRRFSISLPVIEFVQVSDWCHLKRRKVWPYLLFGGWLACTLHLSHLIYHQYAYDYYEFRLARVRWLNQTQPGEVLQSYGFLESEDYLLERMRECTIRLEQMGAPLMDMAFFQECASIFILLSTAVLYLLPCVYFTFAHPFDFYFVRNLFDYEREQRRCARFVEAQVYEFSLSLANWTRVLLNASVKCSDGRVMSSNSVGLIDCATIERSLLLGQLDEMLRAGELRPLNQAVKWVNRWSLCYTWILLAINVYIIGSNLTLISLMIYLLGKVPAQMKLNEWLIYGEIGFLLTIVQICGSLGGASLVFTCLDQVMLVNKLREWLALIVELNNLRFKRNELFNGLSELASSSPGRLDLSHRCSLKASDFKLELQMNRDLLLFLIHYKLFLAQFLGLKRSLCIIVVCAVSGLFAMPILGRLHTPYLKLTQISFFRPLLVIISVTTMLPVSVYMVPVCYLNKRCLDLYRELNSLLAHITQISLQSSSTLMTHDRYVIISLLRKELAHHDQLKRLLTVQMFNFNFTYDTILRLYFYAGLIIISTMGENLAQIREPTGTIFTDPLGFF